MFDYLDKYPNEPENLKYAELLGADRIFLSKELRINTSLPNYGALLSSFVKQLNKADQLCLNIHRNFDLAHSYFPNARFIHLRRDPRDVARSSIGMGWAGNVYYGVDHWIATEKSWSRLKPLLGKEQYIELTYENLITNVDESLNKICGFLNLEYNVEMLGYSNNSTYDAPDPKLAYQWKSKLTDRDIGLVEWKTGDLLRYYDYETRDTHNQAPSVFERIKLWLQNQFGRAESGFKTFGLGLYLYHRTSNRMPKLFRVGKLDAKVRQIEIQNLK